MKRFAKHLLPLCMMLTVAAVPGASFAAQPDSGTGQRDIGTYQYCSQWMHQGQCGQGQNDFGQCGSLFPDRPDKPGCSASNHCSNGSDCTGTADCPNLPGNQEKPQKPEPPQRPNQPGDQERPEKPETPQKPEKPETPQKPEKPETPQKPEKPDGTEQPDGNIGAYQNQVVSLVNQERAKQGLSPLKVNAALSNVATKKAEDMRDKGYFSHTSPTYGSPFDMMKQFGIRYSSAGENIAKGQKTPQAVMNGWMNSQGHRDNILNSRYTEIGVGYVTDGSGNTYWVQMFIRP